MPPPLSASATIQAPPPVLYSLIADYREGHPRIIPRPPFVSLDVEEGGTGAGTVIRVGMKVLGSLQSYRAWITEPEPGRVLVETSDTGYVTSFTVDPGEDGRSARVTISTDLSARRGLSGVLERLLMPRLLRPVFVEELRLLAAAAGAPPPHTRPG